MKADPEVRSWFYHASRVRRSVIEVLTGVAAPLTIAEKYGWEHLWSKHE